MGKTVYVLRETKLNKYLVLHVNEKNDDNFAIFSSLMSAPSFNISYTDSFNTCNKFEDKKEAETVVSFLKLFRKDLKLKILEKVEEDPTWFETTTKSTTFRDNETVGVGKSGYTLNSIDSSGRRYGITALVSKIRELFKDKTYCHTESDGTVSMSLEEFNKMIKDLGVS